MKIGVLTILMVLVAVGMISCGNDKTEEAEKDQKPVVEPPALAELTVEVAKIETDMGTIMFRFYMNEAPNHVKNFKSLTRQGFYDGCTFHRVIPGFMIQGGDPLSKDNDRSNDGEGGPGHTIKAEFSDLKHVRGIVSMARTGDPDSAGSQFFIMVNKAHDLDGLYTIFGKVISGMDTADKIVAVPRDIRNNPLEKVVMKKVSIVRISQSQLEKLEAQAE